MCKIFHKCNNCNKHRIIGVVIEKYFREIDFITRFRSRILSFLKIKQFDIKAKKILNEKYIQNEDRFIEIYVLIIYLFHHDLSILEKI